MCIWKTKSNIIHDALYKSLSVYSEMTTFISFVYFENMKVNRMISKQNVINGIMQSTLSFIYQHLLIYITRGEKSKKFPSQKNG